MKTFEYQKIQKKSPVSFKILTVLCCILVLSPMLSPILKAQIKVQQVSDSLRKENISKSIHDQMYMLTYDHGGLVLWGTDHFAKYLHSATDWLDHYPGFKIGLDNEAYTYDFLKQNDTALPGELKGYLKRYSGRFSFFFVTTRSMLFIVPVTPVFSIISGMSSGGHSCA